VAKNLRFRFASRFAASFTYVESWRAIALANSIFGFNGWSSSVVDITPDFVRLGVVRFRPAQFYRKFSLIRPAVPGLLHHTSPAP
jgi:hypothetical protein